MLDFSRLPDDDDDDVEVGVFSRLPAPDRGSRLALVDGAPAELDTDVDDDDDEARWPSRSRSRDDDDDDDFADLPVDAADVGDVGDVDAVKSRPSLGSRCRRSLLLPGGRGTGASVVIAGGGAGIGSGTSMPGISLGACSRGFSRTRDFLSADVALPDAAFLSDPRGALPLSSAGTAQPATTPAFDEGMPQPPPPPPPRPQPPLLWP